MYLAIGPISIRWYTVILIIAILLPYYLIRKKSSEFKIKPEEIDNLFLITIPLGIVGARLYHVIDKWSYYQNHLLEVVYLWQGGLGIFGGLFVGGLFSWYYCQKKKIDWLNLLDLITPYLLLGQAVGRVGNYFNFEGYGPLTILPWGVVINGQRVHPTFFYEALWDFVGFLVLLVFSKTNLKKGLLTSGYLIIYGSGRILTEYFRIDTATVGSLKIGYLLGACLLLAGLNLALKSAKIVKY